MDRADQDEQQLLNLWYVNCLVGVCHPTGQVFLSAYNHAIVTLYLVVRLVTT